jgi:hypothetical protein
LNKSAIFKINMAPWSYAPDKPPSNSPASVPLLVLIFAVCFYLLLVYYNAAPYIVKYPCPTIRNPFATCMKWPDDFTYWTPWSYKKMNI